MYKGIAKLTRRIKEATGETDITQISDDFRESEKAVDATEAAVKDLLIQSQILLQPCPANRAKFNNTAGVASRLTGGNATQKYPQQEQILATTMDKHANVLDSNFENCILAKVMKEAGETFRHLSEARDDLDYSIKQNVFESWHSMLTLNMKEIREGRTKLNSRRVFYDHVRDRSQQHPEKVTPMELDQARNKLEETVRIVDNSMDAILCSDLDRAAQLKQFIDSNLDYHERAAQKLRQLSTNINSKIQAHVPRKTKGTMPTISNQSLNLPSISASKTSSNDYYNSTSGGASLINTPTAAPRSANENKNYDPWTQDPPGYNNQTSNNNSTNTAYTNQNNASKLYALPPGNSEDTDPFNLNLIDPMTVAIPNRNLNQSLSSQSKPCCKALYDFEPEQPGELAFKAQDLIELVNKIDDNWFEGKLNGISGHFPINYVQVITPL